MKIFGGKSTSISGVTGVSLEGDGLAVAHVEMQDDSPQLVCCAFWEGDATVREERLQEEVKARGLTRSRGIGVVSFGSYGLFQVEPPPVPDAELRDAVRWQVKDLIDYPLEEAVVDVFRVGADARREGTRNAYVVAARQAVVRQHVDLLRSARLKIDTIDIPELCLRNIAALLPEDPRGVSLLYLGADSGVVIVCRGGRLQLARDIPFGYMALCSETAESQPGAIDDLQERLSLLALDIQRSLDFYESSFRQTPVAALYLLPAAKPLPDLLPELQSRLGTTVKPFILADIVDGDKDALHTADRCLLAVGAALRNDKGEA